MEYPWRAEPVHRQMVRLVALNRILRLFARSMNAEALERDLGGMLLLDRPPDSPCFRVPFKVISNIEASAIVLISYSSILCVQQDT
jgi:hypothetical protein